MTEKLTQVHRTLLGGFANPWSTWVDTRWRAIFTLPFTTGDPDMHPDQTDPRLDQKLPVHSPKFGEDKDDGVRLTWVGHATVLFQVDGARVIFDPIFSESCSYFGPARYRPPPCKVNISPSLK